MKTRAEEIVPAAVISIGNMRGRCVRGEEHPLVARDRRHRRQRVHALGARDARHQLHREQRRAGRGDLLDGIGRAERIGEADDRLALAAARASVGVARTCSTISAFSNSSARPMTAAPCCS